MLDIERREELLRIIKEEKSASVETLAKKIFSSPATIRRDLTKLQEMGLIRRVHGVYGRTSR